MTQHLQQFTQQLAIWTQTIIDHGRTPFRRVDTYPHLDTEQGILQPPLVFWINRQSMMAGGVLLLPDNNLAKELERGRSCASALGLQHFVTWETDQVRIWHIDGEQCKELRSFPLANLDQLDTFRYLLAEILDELKLLSVLGAIPVANLSPCYFNNLFQATLQQALPPLIKAYREQRSEMEEHSTEDADTCANEASRLLILQIISSAWFDSLPKTTLPEKLERAIELSLADLPKLLQQTLSQKTIIKPPPLPLDTAVCFHHLLLRLQQLSWDHPPERAKQSINRLIQFWYQDKATKQQPAAIQLYPEVPPLDPKTEVILSSSPAFLAATALVADIKSLGRYKFYSGNLFQFGRNTFGTRTISARLLNTTGIKSTERHEFTTKLRLSWPNRHLKIKTGQPFWRWELVHLLGLCHTEQKLSLQLPAELLRRFENRTAWSLLCENFTFQHISLLNNDNIQFQLSAEKNQDKPFPVQAGEESREITPVADFSGLRDRILLALVLPTNIYNLLETELIWPDREEVPDQFLSGWKSYQQSLLYQLFRNILQYEQGQIERAGEVSTDNLLINIPYPEPLLLNELQQFESESTVKGQFSSVDHCLAALLECPAIAEIKISDDIKTAKISQSGTMPLKQLKGTISQQLLSHGIPNFPEQYLYFLDQPEINHYTVVPPLRIKSSLLGQFELEDLQGQVISGYGEELEQTLLFCAAAGKTEFELPSDRYQLRQLLHHYKKDLIALHKQLKNLCYSQVEDAKSARKLVKNIWHNLSLPDPSWFKN